MINRGGLANNACTGHRVRVQIDERLARCGKLRWKDFYFEQILRGGERRLCPRPHHAQKKSC